ncbi:MAG: hypothetical protein K2X27_26625 [Candidatus Obscuribacterales bacterium]|nr:hypothetical protein [Candidatus Obscuribacterales bacterium]
MTDGARERSFLVLIALTGVHRFCYRAGRINNSSLLRARVRYCRQLLEEALRELTEGGKNSFLHFGSGRVVSKVKIDAEELAARRSRINSINERLFSLIPGQLCLSYAFQETSARDALAKENEILKYLESELEKQELEPFKTRLDDFFKTAAVSELECDFCGEAIGTPGNILKCICSFCSNLILAENSSTNSELVMLAVPESHNAALAICTEKQEDLIRSRQAKYSRREIFLEHFKAVSKRSQNNESLKCHLIECNEDNFLALGNFAGLHELLLKINDSLSKEYPGQKFNSGLRRRRQSMPASLMLKEALLLASSSAELGDSSISISLHEQDSAYSCSWTDWQNKVKTLIEKIKLFDQRDALGHGFFDYLLNFAESDSIAIYPLMYKLARKEDSHHNLKRDQHWREFKSEMLLALSERANAPSRKILKIALSSYLQLKRAHVQTENGKNLVFIERN